MDLADEASAELADTNGCNASGRVHAFMMTHFGRLVNRLTKRATG
jgi:hypothetical protein